MLGILNATYTFNPRFVRGSQTRHDKRSTITLGQALHLIQYGLYCMKKLRSI